MNKLKIEKGISIPLRKKYPFEMMEIGDSFFVEAGSYASIWNTAKSRGFKKGIRVWRVS